MVRLSRKVLAPILGALLLLGVASACEPSGPTFIPEVGEVRDPATAPVRYADEVFSSVTRTNNIAWGSAPDRDGNAVPLGLDLYQPAGDTVASRPAR